jgi:hypothetical protein
MELKYNAPTKYVQEPYGTIWPVTDENNKTIFYIQASKDSTTPLWITFGDLMSIVHKDAINNKDIIFDALEVYNQQ